VRDVRNGACRIGSFSQNYNARAGSWSPGNTATSQSTYTVPTFPQGCGGGGDYSGLSTIEFSATTPGGTDDWRIGWNVFVRDGLQLTRLLDSTSGASDNITDLLLWALQRSGRAPAALIDTASLLTAARFCDVNGLLCNGEFKDSANLGDWLIRLLPYFLLRETKVGGKFGLRPLVPFDPATGAINSSTITPDWVLGEDVIVPGSFTQDWSDAGTRLAPVLTMIWRQQASETDMPLNRTLQVGLARSESGPFEQHDLSQFAATELHAARVGAYLHGRRYLSTHTAAVQLRPGTQSGLIIEGDVVQVKLNLITGREPDALLSEWYVVEAVGQARDGTESLQLSHFPVDAGGRSLLALLVANATAPGALLPPPALGSCDVAGRSTDTSVPASSTSGRPFSSGGSGITDGSGGSIPGGGFDRSTVPDYAADEREAPKNAGGTPAIGGGLPSETAPGPTNPPEGYADLCPGGFAVFYTTVTSARSSTGGYIQDGPRTYKTEYGIIAAKSGTFTSGGVTVTSWTATFRGRDVSTSGEGPIPSTPITVTWYATPALPFIMEGGAYACDTGGGTPGPTQTTRRYRVVEGDTLYDIAARLLGNANRWPEIYALNQGKIDNPDWIFPGQVFQIPAT
jgi:nucleoid-associated protein YgaU